MPTYREALRTATKEVENLGIYAESVQVLMLEAANQSRNDLYRDYNEEIPLDVYEEFRKGVERLKKDEPLAYILGYTWFYGRKIKVNEDVLIPRPETEELCANVLADIDEYFPEGEIDAADVGTGSGEIAITLKLEEPRLRMIGTDISEDALKVARKNAEELGADVTFLQGDMLEPLIKAGKKFDVFISDPPYIPAEQKIDASVKEYEPHVALFGGDDGLKFYRAIFRDVKKILKDRFMLGFEIGYDQKDALMKLAQETFPEDRVEVLKDIAGKDRMLFVYRVDEIKK
ncbi:MAG: peptide chain release factor N(5)-glutamine methyltransferase [Erysipelotrichales bacterium]|nr:peptide chain release factor N(5)-glutamine methyltransferase [Erysipelotrichales bacterium]